MARIVKGSQYTLTSPTFVGSDQETPEDCASTPTCTVTREDGTSLTAATVSNSSSTNGVYTAAITTTHTSQVDRLQIVWTGTAGSQVQVYRTELEVVGAHYVTLPEIRAESGLDDTQRFPRALLEEIRDEYEDLIERVCGVSFVRRYERDQLDGTTGSVLRLSRIRPRTVLSVTVNGTAKTTTEFTLYDHGEIRWDVNTFPAPDGTNGYRNVAVAYEHGLDAPPPKLRREILKAIRSEALSRKSDLPTNQISQVHEGMTVRFSTPDPKNGRPTGILSLDPVLVELSEKVPGIA